MHIHRKGDLCVWRRQAHLRAMIEGNARLTHFGFRDYIIGSCEPSSVLAPLSLSYTTMYNSVVNNVSTFIYIYSSRIAFNDRFVKYNIIISTQIGCFYRTFIKLFIIHLKYTYSMTRISQLNYIESSKRVSNRLYTKSQID